MREIPLTKGCVALVDDEDYTSLSQWSWAASHNKTSVAAVRQQRCGDGRSHLIKMHRQILNAPSGVEVDHINGNPLDNRRTNLRLASRSQNARNRRRAANNTRGVPGVRWHRQRGKWNARIKLLGKEHSLGMFEHFDMAVQARKNAERQLFGEFAWAGQ
jgi:hypothetical protein